MVWGTANLGRGSLVDLIEETRVVSSVGAAAMFPVRAKGKKTRKAQTDGQRERWRARKGKPPGEARKDANCLDTGADQGTK